MLGTIKDKYGERAWVRWVGYNFLGDTLEPFSHVFPALKLTSFLKSKSVTVDLKEPRARLAKHIIKALTSNKISERGPTFRKESTIDALSIKEVGIGILKMVKPAAVKLMVDSTGSTTDTSLELWDLDQIADLVAIHVYKPEFGHGALRIHCGNATFEDMMMVIPPLKLTVHEGASVTFKVELTTMTFNGLYGTPKFPKIIKHEDNYSTAERGAMVEQAKMTLEQLWRTSRLPHNLINKGWHRLPAGVGVGKDRLPANTAIPRAAVKRAAAAEARKAAQGAAGASKRRRK